MKRFSWASRARTVGLISALAVMGCTASLERTGEGDGATRAPNLPEVPGGRRVWRLTRAQYDNTVKDLLGTAAQPAQQFLPEEGGTGFRNAEFTLGFSEANFFDFEQAARQLARETVSQRLSSVLPCPDANDETCAQKFVESFGLRAFRRPLSNAEKAAYFGIYSGVREDLDGATGIQLVIEAMLISPNFLFRSELSDPEAPGATTVVLTDYEIASQLSYTLWNTMPDPELMAAAADGKLSDPDERNAQARRLLDDPRSVPVLTDFYLQLLEYDKLATTDKADDLSAFGPAKPFMAQETTLFIEELLRKGAPLTELFTANYSFVNEPLAKIYGLEGISGAEFQRVELPSGRAGVLTHPGFLSIQATVGDSSPVRRGYFVLHQLLCKKIAEPSADIVISLPKPSETKTTRERFEELTQREQPCSTCHKVLNPPGFLFENFDAIGAARTKENGVAVDTNATLASAGSLDGEYRGFGQFAPELAKSSDLVSCMALQNLRFALGRGEASVDGAVLAEMHAVSQQGSGSLREILLALVAHPSFVQRVK